jgi:hypothetical protein
MIKPKVLPALLIAFLLIQATLLPLRAEEGMWLPQLIKLLNEKDMQAKGMKISAEDIYSLNRSSLKDAVISFGGFCTGEFISSEGLLLTNHHCGLDALQSHASVEKDYVTNGYWAMNKQEELPNPGLFITVIKRIEEVTAAVNSGTEQLNSAEAEKKRSSNISELEKKAVEGSHFKAFIRSFAYGNEYYLFVTETFNDVRLVGAPPKSIGNFGGDTDNWMWPRHNADFMVFRVYAGKDNMPAAYSADNVPYRPAHHLPISLKGIKETDFTMVMGFPGRTQEYLSSYALRLIVDQTNPNNIEIRTRRLKVLDEMMRKSDKTRIQYVAKYASVSNAWKKWQGESRGLVRSSAIAKKESLEKAFGQWASENSERQKKYGHILSGLKLVYDSLSKVNLAAQLYREALSAPEVLGPTSLFYAEINSPKPDTALVAEQLSMYEANQYFKDLDLDTDRKVMEVGINFYRSVVGSEFHPKTMALVDKKFNGNIAAFCTDMYSKSGFTTEKGLREYLQLLKSNKTEKIKKDPLYQWYAAMATINAEKINPTIRFANIQITRLTADYIRGLREMQSDKTFYPDANSTLRVSYGKVEGYAPRDGVQYFHYTTTDGILDKNMTGAEDYVIPGRLKELIVAKDFGKYSRPDGTLPVCFIASNHTTGGNSGSPVISAEGHLIGTNFDRNWEGTMSDLNYDVSQVRNIAVDVRYTLFIIDRFAGAGYLLKEMTLIE